MVPFVERIEGICIAVLMTCISTYLWRNGRDFLQFVNVVPVVVPTLIAGYRDGIHDDVVNSVYFCGFEACRSPTSDRTPTIRRVPRDIAWNDIVNMYFANDEPLSTHTLYPVRIQIHGFNLIFFLPNSPIHIFGSHTYLFAQGLIP